MSKLFEALQKASASNQQTDISAVFLPGEVSEAPVAAAPLPAASEPAPVAGETARVNAEERAAVPPLPEAASVAPEFVHSAEPGYRSIKLQLQRQIPALPFDGSEPRAAEQYRIIRTRIAHHPRQPRICLVSSPSPGDGKTITTLNIAASLALKSGVTAVLVECDLRRSTIAARLGIPEEPGLAGVLEGTCKLDDAIVQVEEIPGFYVLPAGQAHANPTELLDSMRWGDVCADLRRKFQYAVLDSPPIGSVADYELLQNSADGVVVVVRPDHTNRARSRNAIESVPRDKLLGVVVNCAKEWFLHRPSNNYYYAEYR